MKTIIPRAVALSLAVGVPVHAVAGSDMTAIHVPDTVLAWHRDPGDSLYKSVREALGSGDYERAAQLFHDVAGRFLQSPLVPDALYYEAFARYRNGDSKDLVAARDVLATLRTRYRARIPKHGNRPMFWLGQSKDPRALQLFE